MPWILDMYPSFDPFPSLSILKNIFHLIIMDSSYEPKEKLLSRCIQTYQPLHKCQHCQQRRIILIFGGHNRRSLTKIWIEMFYMQQIHYLFWLIIIIIRPFKKAFGFSNFPLIFPCCAYCLSIFGVPEMTYVVHTVVWIQIQKIIVKNRFRPHYLPSF